VLSGPIYEFGSRQMEGQVGYSDIRCFFRGEKFVGIDYIAGPGVDHVDDIRRLTLADGSVKTAICLEVLEHVDDIWSAANELFRVLSEDGILIISVPFEIRIHGSPHDYWRFTPSGLEYLFRSFEHKFLSYVGPVNNPKNVVAVLSKNTIDLSKLQPEVLLWQARWESPLIKIKRRLPNKVYSFLPRLFLGDEFEMWKRRRREVDYKVVRQLVRLFFPPIISEIIRRFYR
jgi:SAM-dependent methyltransferase